jgi:hypothetical protein
MTNKQKTQPLEVDPEKQFATIEEWAEHRYRAGQVVPEGHPAYESWMADFN